MRFFIDDLEVFFPYEYIYPEQWRYMCHLKGILDAKGPCVLEMPSGTGKTVSLLALITSYQLAHPEVGKLIYCSRTVPEIEKVLEELKELLAFRKAALEADGLEAPEQLCLGLSARRKLCLHERVRELRERVAVDSACRDLTASWVREEAAVDPSVETCSFFEAFQQTGRDALVHGVFTLDDLKDLGRERGWCPYFLCRHLLDYADVVVYSYQYILNPKIYDKISKKFAENSIVVFDEAHNIDNVCIEGLSVNITSQCIRQATTNLSTLRARVNSAQAQDASRLKAEYDRLVEGLGIDDLVPSVSSGSGQGHAGDKRDVDDVMDTRDDDHDDQGATGKEEDQHARAQNWLERLVRSADGVQGVEPVLAGDVLSEAVPGNIRKASHFLTLLQRFLDYVQSRMSTSSAVSETAGRFLHNLYTATMITGHTLRFLARRLHSLMRTLQVNNMQQYNAIGVLVDFGVLIATYYEKDGFVVIVEPPDTSATSYDHSESILQFCCLDASIAMQPVLHHFDTVIITSGTLSPLDFYPRLLNFKPKVAISSQFDLRSDPAVIRNYGSLLIDLSQVVPDGMVCFFPSYSYMETIISMWNEMGLLNSVLRTKLLFIETPDPLESTLALANYRRACDTGRGAVLFSVARGKVSEGIDFSHHYGRAVVMFGIPYVYTQSRVLKARLEFLREHFHIREGEFLTFDAMRVAAQCMGRVIRGKTDYGLMIFADKRYARADKRQKLPRWIARYMEEQYVNLSTDMAVGISRTFFKTMAQPWKRKDQLGLSLWTKEHVERAALEEEAGGDDVVMAENR